jgi:RNA polymerase sigma factor (sigma-70 family)
MNDLNHLKVQSFVLGRVKNKAVAEDIAQDAVCKALHTYYKQERTCTIQTWATVIAINLCHDYFKKQKHLPIEEVQELTEVFEIELGIENMLSKVSTKEETQVFKMMAGGMTINEIASIKGVSYEVMKSRIQRMRVRIQEKLRAYGITYEQSKS